MIKSLKGEEKDDQLANDMAKSVKAYIEKWYEEGSLTTLEKSCFSRPEMEV